METVFNLNLPIAIGSDHAGFEVKQLLIAELEKGGYTVADKGCNNLDSADYPDYAHPVAEMVEQHEAAFGILICGSANGVAITANKHQGVRAALCWQVEIAKLARQHNNANVVCLPARFISTDQCNWIMQAFMTTAFEGGRHEKRVAKMTC